MDQTTCASQAEICSLTSSSPTGNVPGCSSSKEKKILQTRRQQRHSTEIGSEYHRWWVVRNALGFETNEHIAGLLLDGFHGLLQHLVVMCGGESYQPCMHGEAKASSESNDCFEDVLQSPSSSSSASPPGGIENMDEFLEYKRAISHYCSSLWRLCCQQGSQLQQLDKTSQPVQEFLIRLMGYLRAAKGKNFSVNPRKKQLKPNSVQPRSMGESISPQISIAKSCSQFSFAHREIQCASVASASNQAVSQDVAKLAKYDQGKSDKETADSNILSEKQVEGKKENSSIPVLSKASEDKDKQSTHSWANSLEKQQTVNTNFQVHHTPASTEPKDKSNNCKNIQNQAIVHSQPEHAGATQAPGLLNQETSQQQYFHLQQEVAPAQDLSLFSRQPENFQRHSEVGLDRSQQQWKHGQQNETPCQKIEIFTGLPCSKQELTLKDDRQQQKQGQSSCLENKQLRSLTEKDLSSHWWSNMKENCIYLGMSPGNDVKEPVPMKDCSFKMCAGVLSLEGPASEEKSVGELGLLLTDSLKMMPRLEEAAGDVAQSQGFCSDRGGDREGPHVQSLASQTDLPVSSASTPVTTRQAQSCQTSISMILPAGPPAAVGLGPNKAQSLLNIPKQKAKETQTSTSFYNEIKINWNNPKRISEVKPQKGPTNPTLQPIQPAVFPATDKSPSLTTSLGTPVILYPARSFSSNDNSLASLASLVQNIVYSSYGTILKPLSITSLPSTASYNPQQVIPTNTVSASDSNSQRKPIAAALPVLSSQLSANKPTLVPFYISHAAVNTLGSFSKCAALSGLAASNQNTPGLQIVTQPNCQQSVLESSSLCQGSNNTDMPSSTASDMPRATASNIPSATAADIPSSSTSDMSCRTASDTSHSPNQLKITDVRSCTSSEFADIETRRKETLELQIAYPSPGTAKDLDNKKEINSNNLTRIPQSTSLMKTEPAAQNNEQHFNSSMKNANNVKIKTTDNAVGPAEPRGGSDSGNLKEVFAVPSSQSPSECNPLSRKSTSKILNSLLANKEVGVNNSIYGIGQVGKSMDALEACNSGGKSMNSDCNLKQKKTDEISSIPQKENLFHQRSTKDSIYEQPRSGADSQSDLRPRSASMSSLSHRLPPHRRLNCPVCNLFFCSSMDLLVHRFEQHGHVCGECDSRFLTLSRLKHHKETDHPPVLLCSHCRFHTFKKEELARHSWSEHGITEEKDESQLGQPTESKHDLKKVFSPSPSTALAPQKSASRLVNPSLACPSKSENACHEASLSDKAKESDSARGTSQRNGGLQMLLNDASCIEMLQKKVKCEDESHKKVLLEDREVKKVLLEDREVKKVLLEDSEVKKVLLEDREVKKDLEPACSGGAVFPSFSRTVIDPARPDLDSISAMYAQVSLHCQLDSTDYLNTPDQHLSENEEPRLVIDTGECKDSDEKHGKAVHSSSFNSKSGDKLCRPGSNRGRMNRKQIPAARNNTLCKAEVDVRRLEENDSRNSQLEEENKCVGKGRERKRLVMSIKRRNSTPGCESQSRRRKRTKNGNDGLSCGEIKSVVDIPFVKASSETMLNDGFYISSSSVSGNSKCEEVCAPSSGLACTRSNTAGAACDRVCKRNERANTCRNNCDIVSKRIDETSTHENSGDKVTKRNDKTSRRSCDKVSSAIIYSNDSNHGYIPTRSNYTHVNGSSCKIGFCQKISSTLESQPDDHVKATLDLASKEDPSPKQIEQQSSSYKDTPNMKPCTMLYTTSNESSNLKAPTIPQTDLSLQESHLGNLLPPKKKKAKKAPIRDQLSEKETANILQYGNNNTIKDQTPLSEVSVKTSPDNTAIHFLRQAEKIGEIEGHGGAEVNDVTHNQKKPASGGRTSLENKVEPAILGQTGHVAGRRYECPVSNCNVTFCRRWNMKDHMLKVHAQSPLIVCSVTGCDLKFSNKRELRQHVTVDHMGKTRKYMCSWPDCSKGFFARTHLSIHTLTHTGEKPVACDVCDYRCRQRTALIWHMRKHGVFHKTDKIKNLRNSISSSETKMAL